MKKTIAVILIIMLIFGFTGGPLNHVYATSGPTYVTGGTDYASATLLTDQSSYLTLIPEWYGVDDGFGNINDMWYNNKTYFKFIPAESGVYTLTVTGAGESSASTFEFQIYDIDNTTYIEYESAVMNYNTPNERKITVQAGVAYYLYVYRATSKTTYCDVIFDKTLQSTEGASEPSVLTIDLIDDITMDSLEGSLPRVTVRDENGDEVTGKTKKYTCEELSDYGAYISSSDRYIELGSNTPNGTYTVTVSLEDDSAEPITFDIIVKIIRPAAIVLSPQYIELVKDGTENPFTVNFPAAVVYDNEGNPMADVECGIIDGDFETLDAYIVEADDGEGEGEETGFQLSKEIPLGTYHFIYGLRIEKMLRLPSDSESIPEITSAYEMIVRNPQISYTAGDGGSITGETSQTVEPGARGTAVTAVADDGYTFSRWSDGITTAARTDTNVSADLSVTAEFETMLTVNIDENFAGATLQEKVETILDGKSNLSVIGLNITAGELTDDDILWITNNLTQLEILSITDNASFTDDTLPDSSFANLRKLKIVTIDLDTMESLSFGNGAFHYCYSLEAVDMPQAVDFGIGAFLNNYKLTNVFLPKAKSFGGNSFNECQALTEIRLPNTEAVGVASFVHCIRLRNVDLPKLEVVQYQTFAACEELISVNLLNANEFGDYIFWACKKPIEMKLGSVPPIVIYDAAQPTSGTFAQYLYEGISKVLIPEEALEAYKSSDGWNEAAYSWCGWPAETYKVDTAPPSLTAGTVSRTSDTECTVTFTTNEEGSYYYAVAADGAEAPVVDTSGAGTACTTAETSITNPVGLTAGAKDIYIKVKDAVGNVSIALKIDIPAFGSGGGSSSGGKGGGGNHSNTTTPSSQEAVTVIVNGQKQNAGTETKTTEDGKSTVTVEVDNRVIENKIIEAINSNTTNNNNLFQVPVEDTKSDIAKVGLTGDIVKKLEENHFDVSVKRDNVEYVIPAEEFTISNVAKNLGVAEKDLADIKVEVKITRLDEIVIKKYNEAAKANGAELVFPPVSFEVMANTTKTDGKTGEVEISKFSNYVERVMEIPAGVDPGKITTGIVFNADGTYSHVPTTLYQKDGKWYAKLNSLTNSNYSVVWNPVTVKSVENHWAKDAVNDMASRLVVMNPESFEPNKTITRADFAEYIVRALGLYREDSTYENKFKDVDRTGAKTLAIQIANKYGIITGYSDGTFRGDAQITREEAMTMYQRAMKITKLEGTDESRYQNYTDYNQVGSWATAYVKEVLSAHVFNGTSDATISPKSNMTYAEAAQAIRNLLVESKLINNN